MLTMNGKKMSKSTGNNILPEELFSGDNPHLTKSFSPSVVRFFMLQAHYRSILDFSNEALLAAEKGFNRLLEGLTLAAHLETSKISSLNIDAWKKRCYDAMNDDFNSPILIAELFEGIKMVHLVATKKETLTQEDLINLNKVLNDFFFDVLGLTNPTENNSNTDKLSGVVNLMIQMRNEARANRNFALSDQIRDQLAALNIQLKDGKNGTTFSL
jgi:cysteinyl-tRNA synthetase